MGDARSSTTVRNVLDPLTGQRRDVVLNLHRSGCAGPVRRELDGSAWWILPAAIDADAHMPFVPAGIRQYDLLAALSGGVHHMVVALPYQLASVHPLPALIADMTSTALPSITPVLSVGPTTDSEGFPRWLSANIGCIRDLLPGIVKLYTPDPNFQRNLDAVRNAGLKPAVFAYTADEFDLFIESAHSPLHVRHVTSRRMYDRVRAVPGATCQTSPHMLLALAAERREELAVLPTPPNDEDRLSLVSVFDGITVVASDHVSPPIGAPTGPGLQTQQHFTSALLTCVDQFGFDLAQTWQKVTSAPVDVFELSVKPGAILVDPELQAPVELWPRQRLTGLPTWAAG